MSLPDNRNDERRSIARKITRLLLLPVVIGLLLGSFEVQPAAGQNLLSLDAIRQVIITTLAGVGSVFLPQIKFDMVVSGGAAACLPNAKGKVKIVSIGPVEIMDVVVTGLPPNTGFDFFVIQLPRAPFGLSWYQGDIDTNVLGTGHGTFMGRFNIETFIVAPGSGAAPVVHDEPPFPDASSNPATAPVHTFHLGLWFNSPADAVSAGCPGSVTPFNGDHTAGIQVLNTGNFPDLAGPLSQLQ